MPLADDDIEKWKMQLHTKVKHNILEKYLLTWLRKIQKFGKICYFDCFAGRGRYKDDELGSPLIALNIAANNPLYKNFVVFLIEKNHNNSENLKEEINNLISESPEKYKKIQIIGPINAEFKDVANEMLNKVPKIAPSFFFIDPFGFSGVPFNIIKRIMEYEHTEVFITFMTKDLNRFLNDSSKENAAAEIFGSEEWKKLIGNEDTLDRQDKLKGLYVNQLSKTGKIEYIRDYKVGMDEQRQTSYYLVHATNSFDGFKAMTDVMFNASSSPGRFAYLGPENAQSRLCDFSDNIERVKKFILDSFYGKNITYREVIMILYKSRSDCIEKHYRTALKSLREEKKIHVDRISSKTERGLQGDDLITFPNQ